MNGREWMKQWWPVVIAAFIGGGASAGVFFIYATVAEAFVFPSPRAPGPILSYGQESFITLVLVTVLGASGAGVIPTAIRPLARDAFLLLIPPSLAVFVCLLASSLWRDSLASYGQDLSDLIVFVALYAAAAGAACCSILCGVLRAILQAVAPTEKPQSPLLHDSTYQRDLFNQFPPPGSA